MKPLTTCRVMFCCNDEHGRFAEGVEIIEVADEIRIVCQKPRPPVMRWAPGGVRIGRRAYECRDVMDNVGNVYWCSGMMPVVEARLLVRELLGSGWSVEEHAESGPFADLVSP